MITAGSHYHGIPFSSCLGITPDIMTFTTKPMASNTTSASPILFTGILYLVLAGINRLNHWQVKRGFHRWRAQTPQWALIWVPNVCHTRASKISLPINPSHLFSIMYFTRFFIAFCDNDPFSLILLLLFSLTVSRNTTHIPCYIFIYSSTYDSCFIIQSSSYRKCIYCVISFQLICRIPYNSTN
jgi:hypothetical protein